MLNLENCSIKFQTTSEDNNLADHFIDVHQNKIADKESDFISWVLQSSALVNALTKIRKPTSP